MNIFYIDKDPVLAAQYHVDKHIVKMPTETAQILSTCHRYLDGKMGIVLTKKGRRKKVYKLDDERENLLYKATHINHPSTRWAMASNNNYNWLYYFWLQLCKEYTYRYGKTHLTETKLSGILQAHPKNIPIGYFTPPTLAAKDPERFICGDRVEEYRSYYRTDKTHLFSWKKREKPEWLNI